MICVYCGYANGMIAYAREIFSRTDVGPNSFGQYPCIKKECVSSTLINLPTQSGEDPFFDYCDAEPCQASLKEMRRKLAPQALNGKSRT